MNEYTLRFTLDDLRVIDEGLQEVKHRLAVPVIAKINAQIQAQELQSESSVETT